MTLHSEFFVAYDVFDTNVVQTGVLIKVWLGYTHPPSSAELHMHSGSLYKCDIGGWQHVLALFRTQHIAKLAVQLETTANALVATISSENGMQHRPPYCLHVRWRTFAVTGKL